MTRQRLSNEDLRLVEAHPQDDFAAPLVRQLVDEYRALRGAVDAFVSTANLGARVADPEIGFHRTDYTDEELRPRGPETAKALAPAVPGPRTLVETILDVIHDFHAEPSRGSFAVEEVREQLADLIADAIREKVVADVSEVVRIRIVRLLKNLAESARRYMCPPEAPTALESAAALIEKGEF